MMKMEHEMKIIDGHVHLVQCIAGTGAGGELRFAGNGMAEYASGERFRMLPDEFSQGVVTAGDILRKMDENGVEKAVLLQGNYFGFQNLYSMEAVKKYPYPNAVRYLKHGIEIAGADRLIFGTDIPSVLKEDSYQHLIQYITCSDVCSREEKELIMYRNAEQVYFR